MLLFIRVLGILFDINSLFKVLDTFLIVLKFLVALCDPQKYLTGHNRQGQTLSVAKLSILVAFHAFEAFPLLEQALEQFLLSQFPVCLRLLAVVVNQLLQELNGLFQFAQVVIT